MIKLSYADLSYDRKNIRNEYHEFVESKENNFSEP